MKRIQVAGLCLVVMFAASGIAAGSASAKWFTYRWTCAYMPVTEQTREKNAAEENKEGYYATQEECEKHGPNWTNLEIAPTRGAGNGIGPWIGVEAKPGPLVEGLECRHAARPRPGRPGPYGEPGPYEDSSCEFVGPVPRCEAAGRHNEPPETGCPYALVEPPPAEPVYFAICEKVAKGSPGEYTDKNCWTESPGDKGTFNLVSYAEATASYAEAPAKQKEKFHFTDKSNAVTLGEIKCQKSTSKGEVISNTETKDEFTFEKCKKGKENVANIESGPVADKLLVGGGGVLTEYSAPGFNESGATTPVNVMSKTTKIALPGKTVNNIKWKSKVEIVNE